MMSARAGLASLSLIVFMLRRRNTPRRLGDVYRRSGLRRCCRMVGERRGDWGRVGRLRLIQDPRQETTDVLKIERTKARHPTRGIEIPCILRQADEIADGGISCPSLAKRRARQLQRHARREESRDV